MYGCSGLFLFTFNQKNVLNGRHLVVLVEQFTLKIPSDNYHKWKISRKRKISHKQKSRKNDLLKD